jgi:hypothetical protein
VESGSVLLTFSFSFLFSFALSFSFCFSFSFSLSFCLFPTLNLFFSTDAVLFLSFSLPFALALPSGGGENALRESSTYETICPRSRGKSRLFVFLFALCSSLVWFAGPSEFAVAPPAPALDNAN